VSKRRPVEAGQVIITVLAAVFFGLCTWASYARWANFAYRTFDLAYYVQALWQLLHGRWQVSVENVPLLGNHVEPIVFLFLPLFALFRHPMLFVVVQNAALASMALVGYGIARRLGFDDKRACLLGGALLLAPAAGYIALHEFHPEALTAPFLLLMLQARLAKSVARHWLWFLAVLACKENMALLLGAYCVVLLIIERKRRMTELRRWYLGPLAVAVSWFILCAFFITPAFNSGNIDYLTLYDRLGTSGSEILRHAFTQPQLILHAVLNSLRHGNLIWALLLPFLGLPLLRPRWLVVAGPIILQHLLSWRSSEWTIYFHYAAPLLPLFWIAAVEAIAPPSPVEGAALLATPEPSAGGSAPINNGPHRCGFLQRNWIPRLLLGACLVAQAWLGPAAAIASDTANYFTGHAERARKKAFIAQIPAQASVVAPLPYLSHLALRENLYSLHYILKGLKTLSHAAYEPPDPTDFVLIDYKDAATFDAGAGYYHPAMQTKDGRVIPSSERLLHNFLKRAAWKVEARNALTLLQRSDREVVTSDSVMNAESDSLFEIGTHTQLTGIQKSGETFSRQRPIEVRLHWKFRGERDVFPWMLLRLSRGENSSALLTKGLCAPEVARGDDEETWHVTFIPDVPAGDYKVEAIFLDNARRTWVNATGGGDPDLTLLAKPIPLGNLRINPLE
jgi:uncharacterized membrane protein